jgi:hypothetical protein
MKTRTVLAIVLLAASLPARSQGVMNAGDSFTYHFVELPFFQRMTPPLLTPNGQFVLSFNNATLDSTDSLRMEMFEGTPDGPVISQLTLDSSTFPSWAPLVTSPSAWADHEGSIRVTALSGSFAINEVIVQRNDVVLAGSIDIYQLRITPVPEPSPVAFAGLGVLGIWMIRWRRKRH